MKPMYNQLTKLSHQRGFHETHVYVVDLLRRLKAILGEYRQASYKIGPAYFSQKTFEISLSLPVRSIPHTNASFVQRLPKNPGSFHSSSRISSCRMNNRCYSLPSV